MFRVLFRLVRYAFLAALAAAAAARLLLKSHAEPQTEEIDLVNIFGVERVASAADPFYGGKVTAAFSGTILDLRRATPAPTGIYLDVLVVFAGIDLVVPEGWRVMFEGKVFAGGFDDATATTADPDVPVVRIAGTVLFGGLRVSHHPIRGEWS